MEIVIPEILDHVYFILLQNIYNNKGVVSKEIQLIHLNSELLHKDTY